MPRLPHDLPRVRGVRHRFVQLSSMRMHVAEAGDGPPLLMLHGWPQNWWCYRLLIADLARRFRVLVPDLRGLGWSEAPAAGYEKATLAADILELLDSEQIEQVDMIGHDWGGFVAFLLALEEPARVRRLLALDIPPPWTTSPSPRLLAAPALGSYQVLLGSPVLGQVLLRASGAPVRAAIRLGSGPRTRWSEQELELYAAKLREPPRARASSAYYRTFLTRELPAIIARGDRSSELTVPSLLLMGSESGIDRVLRPRSRGLLRVERVAGAGHFLPEEAPEAVLAAAHRWLDGQPDGDRRPPDRAEPRRVSAG